MEWQVRINSQCHTQTVQCLPWELIISVMSVQSLLTYPHLDHKFALMSRCTWYVAEKEGRKKGEGEFSELAALGKDEEEARAGREKDEKVFA